MSCHEHSAPLLLRGRSLFGLFMSACLTSSSACSGAGDGTSGTQSPLPAAAAPGSGREVGHVGNQSPGIEAIPDWNAAALRVREEVAPRLPNPLPPPANACKRMLDAALVYYTRTEGEQSIAVTTIERTRSDDERACTADTSPAAATCVAILLGESAGEYPWLVDQCTRAFPTA